MKALKFKGKVAKKHSLILREITRVVSALKRTGDMNLTNRSNRQGAKCQYRVLTKELDKCYENQLRYIQWIEVYPINNIIHPFEQLGPDVAVRGVKALK